MPPTTTGNILGPNGIVAAQLPGYEAREQQLEMAEAVAEALDCEHHLVVEAGTGVGKSFAYLAPVMLAAAERDKYRVVISTHTISLQEQLVGKDIPFLQGVMPERVNVTLVKGRRNYLSKRRLTVAQQRAASLLSLDDHTRELVKIGQWSKQTHDGSLSDLSFSPAPNVWELVESDSNNCLGRKCKTYGDCFYFKARKRMYGAEILIVNHALFFSDLAIRRENNGQGLLPNYNAVVFDEAHMLEDVAAEHMGVKISRGGVERILNRLFSERRGKTRGLLALYGDRDDEQEVMKVRYGAEEFFAGIESWHAAGPPGYSGEPKTTQRIRQPEIIPDEFSPQLRLLAARLERVIERISAEEEKIELSALQLRCLGIADGISTWLKQSLPDQVYWLEVSGQRFRRVQMASAPIDVGDALKRDLYKHVPTVVMTSATLSTGGERGFELYRQRLGLSEDTKTMQLGSPFDYRRAVELHLFQSMPDPSKLPGKFESACIDRMKEYVARTNGRAFVLFTSNSAMRKATESLRDWCTDHEFTLISQSDGAPRTEMVDKFRRTPRAVLFGVASFWQGVDVPGEALSNVIITKLPFAAPDQPLTEARCEKIDATGGSSFFDYQVPQAVIRLKQGFGRLIRSQSDSGMVVILDPRILTKNYGRTFLNALPECRRFVDGEEMIC